MVIFYGDGEGKKSHVKREGGKERKGREEDDEKREEKRQRKWPG